MFKALLSCCFSFDQTSTALHFQKNKIQIVILAFSRLQIYPGLYQTLQPESSNLAVYALFLNILHIIMYCILFIFFCFLIQDVFVVSIHAKPTFKPFSGSTCILSISAYFNPLQFLLPLNSGVLANIPLIYNAQQHCCHIQCQNIQQAPCTIFQCVYAIFSISTGIL